MWHHWPEVQRGLKSLQFIGTGMNNSPSLLGLLPCSTMLDLGPANGPENEAGVTVSFSGGFPSRTVTIQRVGASMRQQEVMEQNDTWQDIWKWNSQRSPPPWSYGAVVFSPGLLTQVEKSTFWISCRKGNPQTHPELVLWADSDPLIHPWDAKKEWAVSMFFIMWLCSLVLNNRRPDVHLIESGQIHNVATWQEKTCIHVGQWN